MNLYSEDFDITVFSSYNMVVGQYTNQYIKFNRCVKIKETEDSVVVAVSNNSLNKVSLLKEIHNPKKLEYITVKDSDFAEFIGSYVDLEKIKSGNDLLEDQLYSLENISKDAPVVNIINAVCLEAIRRNASDIHIQCSKVDIKVRFRIDGVLQTVKTLDKSIFNSLVSRIKVLSGMNVIENRLCQDGRMEVTSEGSKIDFRVSIVPTINGQSIVLRLFNSSLKILELEQLGISESNYKFLTKALNFNSGLILATGPTGSGKTTTLHAMISKMDCKHLKIITIEDPVEKELEGVDQIQVNNEIGLTFENILRRILRQDPDVIMVGEIRDSETAELAIRAALTGHLILSTLHTNDSVSAITRLKNLSIEPYLIASVLRMSFAQRLVRRLCTKCKGAGCLDCGSTGYKGRLAISESFIMNNDISQLIEAGKSDIEIKDWLIKNLNFKTLSDDANLRIQEGITSREEILREGLL